MPVAAAQLSKLQNRFKNAFVILINLDSDQRTSLQVDIPPGTLRIFDCVDRECDIVHIITNNFMELKDASKFRLQSSYFQQMELQMKSSTMVAAIVTQYLSNGGVPLSDIQILLEGVAHTSSLILASEGELTDNCPIDIYSIQLVLELFQNNRISKH